MDNFYNPGANVAMASDEVNGKHYQKVKVVSGPDDVAVDALSIRRVISAATTNATSAKASAGAVYGWSATNTNAAVMYLKLYNKASAPTVGTDTPVMTIAIPGSVAGGGTNFSVPVGINFSTGIALAITTGVADSDTNAVAANEVVVNLLYA